MDKPDSDLNVNEYDEEAGVIDESEVVVRRSLTNVEREASVRSSSTSAEKMEAFMRDIVHNDVIQPPEEELEAFDSPSGKREAFMRDSVNSDVVQPPEEEL